MNAKDELATEFPEDKRTIHQRIVAIMRAISPIAKDQINAQQKYNFRGVDQVYNEVHPHFAEHGVYSTSEVINQDHTPQTDRNGKTVSRAVLHMRYTFWGAVGDHVTTEVVGEGIDYGGDKASNKAMSAADKYALLQLLKIPTACVDSDREPATPPDAVDQPKVPPRAKRDLEVGSEAWWRQRIGQLYATWCGRYDRQPGLAETKAEFPTWVQEQAGREFDVRDMAQWTEQDFVNCDEVMQ